MGPDRNAQLDNFGLFLPFAYRVAVLLVAGFWGWGLNLQYLRKANIDVPALIRYPARQSPLQISHHASVFRLSTFLSFPFAASLLIFWVATHGQSHLVEMLDFIPQAYIVIFFVIIALPYLRYCKTGRLHFLRALRRVSVGGLAEPQHGKFGDILLADALTSYAKVLGDLYVTFCMFFTRGMSSTGKPDRNCGKEIIFPLIIALPSIIRFRQCLIEFFRVRRAGATRENTGAQHLCNTLKYATAFPVIILTAKSRNYTPMSFYGYSEVSLARALTIAMSINSAYSFYWDVTKDWDFTLLTGSPSSREHPYGLRRHRCFSDDRLYYLAILVDLVIRFAWLAKFVPSLVWLTDRESGVFVLIAAEVARRWMWIFFRVEAEWVRTHRGPAPDDVLLGEVSGKLDAD